MSMIFNFRMISDEDDNFIREYEISYNATLKEFHEFICSDLEYDEYEMTSFFLSDEMWQKLKEFTLEDMGLEQSESDEFAPIPMEQVTLGSIIHNKHERLLYVFDIFQDRVYFIELMEAKRAEDSVEYPRTLLSHGVAPDQFDSSVQTNNKSIFDEAMDDWGDFGGNDECDDE